MLGLAVPGGHNQVCQSSNCDGNGKMAALNPAWTARKQCLSYLRLKSTRVAKRGLPHPPLSVEIVARTPFGSHPMQMLGWEQEEPGSRVWFATARFELVRRIQWVRSSASISPSGPAASHSAFRGTSKGSYTERTYR